MFRLTKYLKPYLLLILITIILLFVQANADLALPDYLGKIINVGIQQGGIENAVPEAIRQSEMAKLLLFISPEEKEVVLNDYTLVDQNSPEYEQAVQDYPTLANEPVYVLNVIDQTEMDKLNPIMAEAFVAVSSITKAVADPAVASAMAAQMGFDLSKLPAGVDIFTVLGKLPADQLAKVNTLISAKTASLNESMLTQAAIPSVKEEYIALGIDTVKLQTQYILHAGMLMLFVTLVSVVCTILVGFFAARTAAGLARDLRRYVF